jgi:phosphocarrier protein HPr
MKQFEFTITDKDGIHARPAGLLVKKAASFPCEITIKKEDKTVSLKKLIALMNLGIKSGQKITIIVNGEQEEKTAVELENFMKENL